VQNLLSLKPISKVNLERSMRFGAVHAGSLILSFLLAALLVASSVAQETQKIAPPSPTQLIGAWSLVSSFYTMKDGRVIPDPRVGPHGQGFLMYSADGHMCAELMNPDRPNWKDAAKPSVKKAAALDGFIGYCGTWKLDAEHSTVTHYPTVAWKPGYVGTTQPRPFRLDGKRLIITAKSDDPAAQNVVLTWERTD
jgi:hypothetical protein